MILAQICKHGAHSSPFASPGEFPGRFPMDGDPRRGVPGQPRGAPRGAGAGRSHYARPDGNRAHDPLLAQRRAAQAASRRHLKPPASSWGQYEADSGFKENVSRANFGDWMIHRSDFRRLLGATVTTFTPGRKYLPPQQHACTEHGILFFPESDSSEGGGFHIVVVGHAVICPDLPLFLDGHASYLPVGHTVRCPFKRVCTESCWLARPCTACKGEGLYWDTFAGLVDVNIKTWCNKCLGTGLVPDLRSFRLGGPRCPPEHDYLWHRRLDFLCTDICCRQLLLRDEQREPNTFGF